MWLGDVTTDSPDSTPADSSAPSLLSQAITGIAQYKLASQQLSTANAVTQLQLQRAQAGLPPLNIDPSTLGVPSVSVGLSPGVQQILQYAVFGVLGLLALGMLAKHR